MNDEAFSELVYCAEKGGCTNAALARVEGRPYCGDHLRRHTLFAYPPRTYRKAQAEMNDRMLRAEAGA